MTGRGLRGRTAGRQMLFAAVALDAVLALLVTAVPSTSGPMFDRSSPFPWLVPAFGIALNLGGLVWMVRIVRADPEGHPSSWRSTRS